MNIGFDAKRAFWNNTGLGNYSRFVITGMSRYFPSHSLSLYSPGIFQHPELTEEMPGSKLNMVDLGKNWTGRFKRVMGYNMQDLDLFHGLSNEIPLIKSGKTKLLVSIHDLLFLRYPEFYSFTDRKIYTIKTKAACYRADLIIAVSKQTKEDLICYLNVPESKIKVHYQACHPQFGTTKSRHDIQETVSRYNITQPYIIQVGTIEIRKNALLTLKAYNQSRAKKDFQLVFLGKRTAYCSELESFISVNKLSDKVMLIYQSDFADFPSLYQGASVSVYPSLFEGFGIPVLEAMCCNVPVITSAGGCFSEVGGDAVIYTDPFDPESLAARLDLILFDKKTADDMIAKGRERALHFTPENLITELESIYRFVVD